MSELAATATQLLVATTPLIFFFLASVVLLSKHKTRATWAWGAFCLFAACTWGSIYFASQTSDAYSLATADIISRIAFASGAFTSLAFFFFALAFTERWQRSRKLITALVVVAAALALGFLFTNGLTVGMEETDFGLRRPKPGPLMPLYLLYTVFNTVGAFVLFVLTYRTSSGHKRLQLRYALVAVVFAVIAGVGSLVPSIGASNYLGWVPSALMIVPPTLVTYAVIRHQLLDVRTVLHKTLLWGVISAVAVAPVWLILEWQWDDLSVWGPSGRFGAVLLFYIVLMLMLHRIQPRIDHLFDRRTYNIRKVLDNFLDDLRRLKDPHGVAASIVHTLQKALYCEFVRVMILDPERDCLIDSHSTKAAKPIERHGDSAAAKICQRLQRLDIVLALDELDEMAADEPGLRLISEFLRERGTAVIVPLVHNEELVGLIELGEKRNLGSYTRTDYELINRIHSGADVALANSLLYQNLQDLTRSLEERVQERTTELRTAYDKLQELDRTKSRFFTNVTHELRTPLTLILAPLEDALLNKQLPDDQRESISMMYRQATQLHRLINDLLDLSKIDAGELRLMIAEFDLDTLLREVITSFEPLAARKSITLDFDPAGSLEPFHGDRNQLERALVNLIGNALKFTPEGGRVALRARAIGNEAVEIEVSDTGIGIPEAFLSRVFDRFAQADDDETRRFEGTGIGLALVREITELHGGRIRVDSEMGHGSTFRMRLPLDPGRIPATAIERRRVDVQTGQYRRSSDRDPLSWMADQDWAAPRMGALAPTRDAGNGAAGSSSPIGTRAVVLVVEDNTDMRRYLVELLSPSYRVITAENGRKGLDVALAELPSVIVSDVMMPEMSGLEMCASLKSSEAGRGIPVLLLTAKKGIERTLEGFESGADDYVTKPFSARELLSRVAVQVKLRRLAEQLALQEKITLMGLVSSGLAHEVKNPANAILNAVEPIRRLASPAPEEREAVGELLDAVLEGARRIVALCDDLLGLARPGEDSVGPWEPTEAIEATLRLLHLKRQESTHVERHLAHNDVPIGVRTQLSQLTMNLLGNALRAAGPEGRVVIGTANDESTFYLTIEDDGPGIPAENLARIFDPLFTTQDVGGGTGLGLYIVRRVVDLHHGVIDVESSPGNGARFRISLPLGHEQPAFQG